MILENWLHLFHISGLVALWFPRIKIVKMLTPGQKVTIILKPKLIKSFPFVLILSGTNYLMPILLASDWKRFVQMETLLCFQKKKKKLKMKSFLPNKECFLRQALFLT